MSVRSPGHASRMHGFSLVELMIALALGLIVIGAVLALVLSIIRSNNQTIAATRLTQELRATAAVIATDLKRAGGVNDPLTVATQAGGNPFNVPELLDATSTGCIRYGYDGAEGGNYHAVSLSGGSIFLDADDNETDAACGGGQRLSSTIVTINELIFTISGRRIDVTLRGALQNDPTIRRSFTQSVFVRSVAGT